MIITKDTLCTITCTLAKKNNTKCVLLSSDLHLTACQHVYTFVHEFHKPLSFYSKTRQKK